MARPPRIEKLRHGRILCGSVFRFFVETWNWLVGYVDNMKGDADVNPQAGHITIDRTDPDHPVVRFRADKAAGGKSVKPDDVSTEFIPHNPAQGADNTHEGELQIKSFNDPTSAVTSSSLADDFGTATPVGHLLYRDSFGNLRYKRIGHLNATDLPTNGVNLTDQPVLTGWKWNPSTHKIEISSAKMTVKKGIITTWTAQQTQEISTTALSGTLPSQSGS